MLVYFLFISLLLQSVFSWKLEILSPETDSSFSANSKLKVTVKSYCVLENVIVVLDKALFCTIEAMKNNDEFTCEGIISEHLSKRSEILVMACIPDSLNIFKVGPIFINIKKELPSTNVIE